jgi:ribose 5-phosphate isomerase B
VCFLNNWFSESKKFTLLTIVNSSMVSVNKEVLLMKLIEMSGKTIVIGCDHAGFELKTVLISFLEKQNYSIIDKGCYSLESIDYPDYGHAVALEVLNSNIQGILICGSGNGINMTANKHKGIRAALCWTAEIASLARLHNDANILTLPGRFVTEEVAKEIVTSYLNTSFEGGRHQTRIDKI